jgi:hypothetical protein
MRSAHRATVWHVAGTGNLMDGSAHGVQLRSSGTEAW